VRQSLVNFGDLSEQTILGALSLIVWALALIVTVKYVIVIMRADNRGEGGLLALTALVLRTARRTQRRYNWIMAAGLWRRAVLRRRGYHPSDLGAECGRGAKVATPPYKSYVIPISLVLLIGPS
jgi:KUP system potassium uptake protein